MWRQGASAPAASARSRGARRSRVPAAGRPAPPRTSRSPRGRPRRGGVNPRAGRPARPRAARDRRSTPRERRRRWRGRGTGRPRAAARPPPRLGRASRARRPSGGRAGRRRDRPRRRVARPARWRRGRRLPPPRARPAPAPTPPPRDARHEARLRSPRRGPASGRTPPRPARTGARSSIWPRRRAEPARAAASRAQAAGGSRAPTQHEDQQSPFGAVVACSGRAIEHFPGPLVGVVHDQQGRALALLRSADDRECFGGRSACVGVPDGHSPPHCFPRQLGRQARLSDASWARDDDHAAVPVAGRGQQRGQLRQLPIPARQQRRAAFECRRQLLRDGRRIERGSCARIASWSARSSAPGSTPISSTSVWRALR